MPSSNLFVETATVTCLVKLFSVSPSDSEPERQHCEHQSEVGLKQDAQENRTLYTCETSGNQTCPQQEYRH